MDVLLARRPRLRLRRHVLSRLLGKMGSFIAKSEGRPQTQSGDRNLGCGGLHANTNHRSPKRKSIIGLQTVGVSL